MLMGAKKSFRGMHTWDARKNGFKTLFVPVFFFTCFFKHNFISILGAAFVKKLSIC